ncbi:hypothetical protein B0H13DRAFT_2442326 [Mycena leptocephala]|nr:hypothetical protein B0H13DRAFT_2442326 [Mycena leptocephala]
MRISVGSPSAPAGSAGGVGGSATIWGPPSLRNAKSWSTVIIVGDNACRIQSRSARSQLAYQKWAEAQSRASDSFLFIAPKSSSVSSGTRKKHARKAQAGVEPSSSQTQEKPEKKENKKHHAVPGLVARLPPPLLVVLRSLGKKAPVTKIRALEELHAGWVAHIDAEDGIAVYAFRDMLPVRLHHLPAHLVHPVRRVRLLAALLTAPLLRPGLTEDAPDVVGSVWALAAHDAERAVAAVASAPAARVQPEDKGPLLAFLERVLLQPDGVYNELNPPAPAHAPDPKAKQRPTGVAPTPAPPPRTKGDEQDESAVETIAAVDKLLTMQPSAAFTQNIWAFRSTVPTRFLPASASGWVD